jgi:hypothetical protein
MLRPALTRNSAIAGRTSPCPSDSTDASDFHPDQHRGAAYEDYQRLIDLGGRPSQSIKPAGPCPPPTYDAMFASYCDHCAHHWELESVRAMAELEGWKSFLTYRGTARTPAKVKSYRSHILKSLRRENISWTIELQLDRQTKLDEWREYYLYHLNRLRYMERRAGDQSQPPKTPEQKCARIYVEDRLRPVISARSVLTEMEAEHVRAEARNTTRPVRRSERLKNRSPPSLPKLPQRTCRVFKSRKKPPSSLGSQVRRRVDSLDAYRSAESL